MKLSFRFFYIVYIVVLISVGLSGIFLIKSTNDTLWDMQIEQANIDAKYAADSFLALADISYDGISESWISNTVDQIKNNLNSTVMDVEIYTKNTVENEYLDLKDNEGISQFIKENDFIIYESVCRLNAGDNVYYLAVHSDFTSLYEQCNSFWDNYRIVAISVSVISGLLLFALTKRIVQPLNQLTKTTDEIASGNYGKKVDVNSSDYEITNLSKSFNQMSSAIEQKIREISKESEKRNLFVADFTHELKTPMTSIIGYSQMLNSYELSDSERKKAVEAINQEANRLERLSLQLLDLYVFQNEKIELELLDLFAIGEQMKATLKYLSEKYDVSFTVNFHNEIVYANSVLLLSLLYNLADNAFKASRPQTCIKIYSHPEGDDVKISLEDKGRGIAKENIKFLTDPFYREDKSRSRKYGGAGLGLSLCKEIASLHGSELNFESETGKGTIVSFTLKKGETDGE